MYIKQSDLFWGMNQDAIKKVMSIAEKVSFDQGDVLFRDGDDPEYLYILVKGQVKLVLGETGKLVYTGSRIGEAFGWSALIDRKEYSATAITSEPTVLLRIERDRLLEILEKDMENGYLFFKSLSKALGKRLMKSYSLIPQ